MPIVLIGVAGILEAGALPDKERAVALLARVLCEQTAWEEYRVRANRLLDRLEAALPAPVHARALAGSDTALTTVDEVLGIALPSEALAMIGGGCARP